MKMIKVIKRNNKKENVNLDKILNRIERESYDLDRTWVIPFEVAQKVIEGVYDKVTTRELDQLAMETAASLTPKHPDYSILAARLAVTSLHKDTDKSFSNTVKKMYKFVNPETNKHSPIVNKDFYDFVMENADELDSAIVHARDFNFDYFGYKTMERAYLLKMNGEIVERPQYLWMRCAIGVNNGDINRIIETYELLSKGYLTHATPTLFNAGTQHPQLSSCFLLTTKEDSIDGIFDTMKQTALISKTAGGIGFNISNVRAKGSFITGTNGNSNGIMPMLRVYNNIARYVDQGGGKRKGSFAAYIEPWHADIFDFLELKRPHGQQDIKAHDLFYAIWMNDLFMERVDNDQEWSLMCPNESPGLNDVYGEEFRQLYEKYEEQGNYRKRIKARELWSEILESQIESGNPYILFKDAINEKSNQKNIGTIKSSNLCSEIVEYTSPDEIAVCNLASIALPKYVNKNRTFNHKRLWDVAYHATINLNNVIDINYYPVEETKNSNFRHRPIGLGVQGLADVFFKMKISYGDEKSKEVNKEIFETIYHAALTASNDLAKEQGSYETFNGSPASKGILQFDMWETEPTSRYDWDKLKESIKKYGLRNSLTTCSMPTASTANILGNTEAAEAQTSNLYTRRTLSGEYVIVNYHLVKDLIKNNLWNEEVRNDIMKSDGSIQHLEYIPKEIRDVYKTVWEISQKHIIDMYADRGAFIDQTQSMNLFMESPNHAKLTSMHFYSWGMRKLYDSDGEPLLDDNGNQVYYRPENRRLKTGIYYLRSRAAADAVKFTVNKKEMEEKLEKEKNNQKNTYNNQEVQQSEVVFSQSDNNTDLERSVITNNSFHEIENYNNDMNCSIDDEDCLSCGS